MPRKPHTHHELLTRASAEALLPPDRTYFRFNGSLTTPPCSEGVVWLVMKQPLTASKEQIDQFAEVMGHHNNRPIQPANPRVVLQ
jgi:carbonic anhydrase